MTDSVEWQIKNLEQKRKRLYASYGRRNKIARRVATEQTALLEQINAHTDEITRLRKKLKLSAFLAEHGVTLEQLEGLKS